MSVLIVKYEKKKVFCLFNTCYTTIKNVSIILLVELTDV